MVRWKPGRQIVECLSSKVTTFLNYTYAGAKFVFGYLSDGSTIFNPDQFRLGDTSTEAKAVRDILADINDGVVYTPLFFGPLSIIYFVSFFVSMLFYTGSLQFIVKKMGKTSSNAMPGSTLLLITQVGCCM